MKVCKCPHIRHINSCINVTYDVVFFTPDETGSAMMNSTYISLLKGWSIVQNQMPLHAIVRSWTLLAAAHELLIMYIPTAKSLFRLGGAR